MPKLPPPKHSRFKPGQSGNPGGRPIGTRLKLQGQFLNKFLADFEKFGSLAIRQCRKKDPTGYVRIAAALLPKEVEIKRPLEELADDELRAAIDALRAFVASEGAGSGSGAPEEPSKTH